MRCEGISIRMLHKELLELGDAFDMDYNTVWKTVSEKHTNMNFRVLLGACKILEIEPGILFSLQDDQHD